MLMHLEAVKYLRFPRIICGSKTFILFKKMNTPVVAIEDVLNHTGNISVVGFLKYEFKKIPLRHGKIINQGCITDGLLHKLEVRMPMTYDMQEFPFGTHVKIKGCIREGQCPYLWVTNKEDVKVESIENKSISQLLKGTKLPKRKDE